MVAIRNDMASMWHLPTLMVRRAVQRTVVPLGILISEFAGSIRRAESFPEAIQISLETLRERVGAQSIMLLDQGALPAQGILLKRLKHYPHPLTLAPSDFETWKRWASEFKPEHSAEIAFLESTGARIAVPLRTKNEIVGVLLLGAPNGGDSYTPAEKQVLSNSADVFALMIENARLTDRALEQEKLRREVALAAEVQRRLLPPEPPLTSDATLAAFTLPARTVGGDYYDFLDLPDGRIGIAIADISGKGIAAALLMSVVQASLRVISADGDVPLSKLAERMNGFLYRSSGSNKYATFFYAQLEDRGRTLRYVNAGHNPPYLMRKSEITGLSTGGTVLGLFPKVQYEEARLDLQPGDVFIAFTDGVTEALNIAGEEFGEERLKDLLRGCAGSSAEAISSKLSDRVHEWVGSAEQHDDLTVVVVAVTV